MNGDVSVLCSVIFVGAVSVISFNCFARSFTLASPIAVAVLSSDLDLAFDHICSSGSLHFVT